MARVVKQYVIGVDGGGTKTVAALADLKGKVLKTAKVGPSSPRNVGAKLAAENIAEAVRKVLRKGEIISVVIGLASVQEQPKYKSQVKRELLRQKGITQALKERLEIVSDQLIAFCSGTDRKDGVLLISGTGCVAHGWRQGKEVHVSGWGWLADEGSAFWVGQRGFQAVMRDLDGRGAKTKITQMALKKLKAKNEEDLMNKVYLKPVAMTPLFSVFCDFASRKGDRVAKELMKQAGQELALSAKTAIRKLRLRGQRFPLVLVGSMFKSPILLQTVEREIKKFAPKVEFIRPKQEPVIGAVKLALENLKL